MLPSETRRTTGLSELVVLQCLERGEMYGYEIAQEVKAKTSGEIEMRDGLLYPLLHDLTARSFLSARRTKVDGRSRVYYRLTARGRKQLDALRGEWNNLVAAMEVVLAWR